MVVPILFLTGRFQLPTGHHRGDWEGRRRCDQYE